MIPDDVVERVAQAADIVQVISEYVPLKRVGNSWRGPCPFHQGTNRNFSVMPTGGYVCFVCGEKGSVFTFLQKRLGLSFVESVRMVGEKFGIDVREAETRRGDGPDPRERYWELNAAAVEYFSRVLWDEPQGQQAREYLAQRHIARDLAERVGLGFAPRESGLLADHLRVLGFDDARQLEGGLMLRREESEEPRPRFRGRLMFPIWDASGRAVGFGGRLLGPGEPKYLNSAESPTFAKGRVLYGLNWAKHAIRRDERVLVVEGYFDAVRLIAAGIESVVAPLGTALTEDQAALLARYTKNVFLLYDSDKAGLKATFRSGDVLLEHGLGVRVVTLPDGEDPDTFVDRHGRDALEHHVASAADIFDRKVQILERAGWFADLHRRRRAIDRLLPTLRATSDPLTRELYVARASEVAGVPRDVLVREIESPTAAESDRSAAARPARAGGGPGGRPGDRRHGERRHDQNTPSIEPGISAERELVRVMLHRRTLVDRLAERVGREKFREPRYREIYGALLDLGADVPLEELSARLSLAANAVVDGFVAEPGALINVDRTFDESVSRLTERDLSERIDGMKREIDAASTDDEAMALTAERQRLVEERRGLGVARYRLPRTQ